jgi:hypothetical protein
MQPGDIPVGANDDLEAFVRRFVENGRVVWKTLVCKKGERKIETFLNREPCPGHHSDYVYNIDRNEWTARETVE